MDRYRFLLGLTVTLILFCPGAPEIHSPWLDCGVVPTITRDPGADPFAPGNWPWLVTLNSNGHHFCSGSLINDQWVLTAASCMLRHDANSTDVYLGLYDRNYPSSSPMVRSVVHQECNPYFNSVTGENDICLLMLSSTVNFTATLRPVCLADHYSMFFTGHCSWVPECWADHNGSLAVKNISVVGNNECSCIHGNMIPYSAICAGPRESEHDDDDDHDEDDNGHDEDGHDGKMCEGDLGAPLIAQETVFWVQFGIVSSLRTNSTTPRAYTRVSEYKYWIATTIDNYYYYYYHYYYYYNPPGFIRVVQDTYDSDSYFYCPGGGGGGGNIFDSGERAVAFSHVTYFASLSGLALYLWVLA